MFTLVEIQYTGEAAELAATIEGIIITEDTAKIKAGIRIQQVVIVIIMAVPLHQMIVIDIKHILIA